MSISTIRVREQFDYALQNNQVCPNMLLMSIAYLVYQIDYNKNVSDETVYTNYLEAERKKIAECAIAHGISKEKIAGIYNFLSKKRYPTQEQVNKLFILIDSNNYQYAKIINDADMWEMDETEKKKHKKRKPIKRNPNIQIEIQQKNDIIDFLSQTVFPYFRLTKEMKNKVISLKSEEYDYYIILLCIRWNYKEISNNDTFIELYTNREYYNLFCYFVQAIKNKLPETVVKKQYDEESYRIAVSQFEKTHTRPYENKFKHKPDKAKEAIRNKYKQYL